MREPNGARDVAITFTVICSASAVFQVQRRTLESQTNAIERCWYPQSEQLEIMMAATNGTRMTALFVTRMQPRSSMALRNADAEKQRIRGLLKRRLKPIGDISRLIPSASVRAFVVCHIGQASAKANLRLNKFERRRSSIG